ncbi:universal stress protein [Streptomyces sp. NPDC085946]|uniref:universal stress protein n=1 Tax=Streptomyces sp. NPDC085946 TaxID=3365744 RepID=UPI0037D22D11
MGTVELPLVVGVDGSDSSDLAVDWAVDEAARHGLPLRLLYASLAERHEEDVPSAGAGRPAGKALADHVVGSAAERARRRGPTVRVLAEVVADEPVSALVAAGRDASALITGARGRGGLTGLLPGSVSLAVAARAPCPVVVVRGDRAGLTGAHERILLGAGEPATGERAVRFAFREAVARGCVLDVVRAWRPAPGATGSSPLAGALGRHHEERASELLDALLADAVAAHPDVRVHRTTVEGPARKVLVHRSAAADLVIVGARSRTGRTGLRLGRVGHTLLHHADCPVALVPHQP